MNPEDLTQLIKKASENKKALYHLKNAAVHVQQYALAAYIGDIEKEKFPQSQEAKTAKQQASDLVTLFAMVGLNIPESTAWLVTETVKRHGKRKGNFDLKDASVLMAKMQEYFD